MWQAACVIAASSPAAAEPQLELRGCYSAFMQTRTLSSNHLPPAPS